jgi:hypothetical protein
MVELGCIFRVLWSGMGTRGVSRDVCCDWCICGAVGVEAQSEPLSQVLLFQMQASKVT